MYTVELNTPAAPRLTPGSGEERDEASRKARSALEKQVDKIAFEKEPFDKALTQLAAKANVTLQVDWRTLESAGLEKATPVTLSLRDVRFAKVLEMLLAEASPDTRLDWIIDEGTVTISTADHLASPRYQFIRVYDLGFLLWDHDTLKADVSPLVSELVGLIQSTVAPESWRDSGGTVGSIKSVGRTLIVNTTARHHRKIDELLAAIKEGSGVSLRAYDVRDIVLGNSEAKVVSIATATLPAERGGRVKQLIETIQSTVARDSWRDKGGATSSLSEFDGKLYVTTTAAVHQQIEELLKHLRGKAEVVNTAAR